MNSRCIVSNFYIKSQLQRIEIIGTLSCIVSNFYIKSQLFDYENAYNDVV